MMRAIVSFKKHSCVLPKRGESCQAVADFVSYAGVIRGEAKEHGAESG